MNEFLPQPAAEYEQGEPCLDRGEIVRLLQELDIDIELEEFDGQDDNDVLGVIATYAAMYDFNEEDVIKYVVPVEGWRD